MGRHSEAKARSEDTRDTKALQGDLEAYRRFFEQSLDALFIIGRNGRIIEASKSATDLLRYSKRQMSRMCLGDLYAQVAEPETTRRDLEQKGYIKDRQAKLR